MRNWSAKSFFNKKLHFCIYIDQNCDFKSDSRDRKSDFSDQLKWDTSSRWSSSLSFSIPKSDQMTIGKMYPTLPAVSKLRLLVWISDSEILKEIFSILKCNFDVHKYHNDSVKFFQDLRMMNMGFPISADFLVGFEFASNYHSPLNSLWTDPTKNGDRNSFQEWHRTHLCHHYRKINKKIVANIPYFQML